MIFDPLTIEHVPDLPDIGPVRLPLPLTSLLGREGEIADISAMLRRPEVRLVSLTGPGGVGKTRLALEISRRVRDDFPNGQYFIQLSTLSQAEQLVPVILDVLRHHHAPDSTTIAELADALEGSEILLVLNSAERVIEARTGIALVLTHLPTVSALVTSRVPLRVRGEHQYAIPYLPLPAPDMSLDQLRRVPSVQLFIDRARSVRPAFDLDEQNARVIVDILHRLDGSPFAIELAALRTRLFPLKVILERLEHLLDFLSGAPHDLPPRLRSMRSAIQWSYDLLSPHEQKVFRSLAVFSGSFSFESARFVLSNLDTPLIPASEVMDDLAQMIDHGFLAPVALAVPNAGYRMPETLRAFGREALRSHNERDDLLARELRFYRTALEENLGDIYGPRQKVLVARLDEHAGNVLAALESARDDNARTGDALRTVTLLAPYFLLRGRAGYGAALLGTFLERATDIPNQERANACRALGMLHVELNQLDVARECYQCALAGYEAAGDRGGIIESWSNAGVVAMKMGDHDRARDLLTRALDAHRAGSDQLALANTLSDMGDLALCDGDQGVALRHYTDSYRIHVDLGNPVGIVCDCVNLLTAAILSERPGPVTQWYETGCRFAEDIGDQLGLAQLQLIYGLLQLRREREWSVETLTGIARALRMIHDTDSRRLMLESLPIAAEACVLLDDCRLAAQVLGASFRTGGENRFAWHRCRLLLLGVEERIRERLGEAEYSRFTTLGTYQTIEQTIRAVLELIDRVRDGAKSRRVTPQIAPAEITVQLTGREKQVLAHVAQGLSDKDIAAKLNISPRTAMTHVSNIMAKMQVHSRSAASDLGIRLGLIEPPREG